MLDWEQIIITVDDDIVQGAVGQTIFFAEGLRGEKGERGDTGPVGPAGPAGPSAEWGEITGELARQADLQAALGAKADATGITLRPDYEIVPASQEPTDGVTALETGKLIFVYED